MHQRVIGAAPLRELEADRVAMLASCKLKISKGEIGRLLALMHEIDHNGLSDLLKPLRGG